MRSTTGLIPLPPRGAETRAAAATRPAGGHGDAASPAVPPARRAVSIVAALGLFGPLTTAWGEIVAVPTAGLPVVALTGLTLAMIWAIAVARSERELARLDRWLLALGLLTLAAWGASKLRQTSGAMTDEAAFLQSAAQRLLHGHDPYGANLSGGLAAYGISPMFETYTTSGGYVTTLGYPSLPVLLTAPFVALLGSSQAAASADLLLLGLATIVMFRALPETLRPLAVLVCIGFPGLANFALAGMTGIPMMVALLFVAYRWGDLGASGRLGRHGVLSAVALGLAASTNQLAWFVAPFLLTAVFLTRRDEHGIRRAARLSGGYAALAVATFALVNLPFVVWEPGAWLTGVLSPLTQHGLPYGQGLVGVSLFAGIGGGAMAFYSYAGGLLYAAMLALFALEFRRLRRGCFVLPLLAFYLSTRSLSGYWTMPMAVIVVSVVAGGRDEAPGRRSGASGTRLRSPLMRALLFVPAATALGVALATPAPMSLRVLGAHSNPATDTVRELRVAVHNGSGRALEPHFATNVEGQASAFWTVDRGPARLAAGAGAIYVLSLNEVQSGPSNSEPFLVQAVTDKPVTVSSSMLFTQPGPSLERH